MPNDLRSAMLASVLLLSPAGLLAQQATEKLSTAQLERFIVPGQPLHTRLNNPAAMAQAKAYYCRRAASGSTNAMTRLGWLLLEQDPAKSDNIDVAGSLFRRAAAHGDPVAQDLASIFQNTADRLPPCLRPFKPLTIVSEANNKENREAAAAAIKTAAAARLQQRARVSRVVAKMARRYRLDPRLVLAIVQLESSFRPGVVSTQQARGLMQLTPDTARRFGVKDAANWIENLRGGMAYLRWLLAYFEGDVILAAAAYNSGEGNVNKYGGVPPFKETMDYIAKLRAIYHRDTHPFDARIQSPSPALARLREQEAEKLAIVSSQ
ncbi:MAG: lytic transglycosylase domain-containing protein [Burkholderiaceae bacterium]